MNIYFSGSIYGGRQKLESYKKLVKELAKFGNVLDEEVSCNQFGSVKDPIKDMVWEKISGALYKKRDELIKADNLKR